uniref:Uncharacterized protein n=1 Tax=Rhizophora mucronata TaxID=61149 RepID=A0A2P2QX81_RHIMU
MAFSRNNTNNTNLNVK